VGLLTGNMQKAAAPRPPAARARPREERPPRREPRGRADHKIFGKDGLSNEEKLRQARAVIRRELGPIGDDLKQKLDEADIPEHLGDLVGEAVPFMADQAAKAAPHVAKRS
jgi:hypothetical protein